MTAVDEAFQDAVKGSLLRRESMQSVIVSDDLLTYTLRSLIASVCAVDDVANADDELDN